MTFTIPSNTTHSIIMKEKLKAAKQYLSVDGKMQSPTSLLSSTGLGGRETRAAASSHGLGDGG